MRYVETVWTWAMWAGAAVLMGALLGGCVTTQAPDGSKRLEVVRVSVVENAEVSLTLTGKIADAVLWVGDGAWGVVKGVFGKKAATAAPPK